MTDRVTIDQYPREANERYATDQSYFDQKIIADSSQIPFQTEISVVDPIYSNAFDDLFGLQQKKSSWAAFSAPPGYRSQSKRLFGSRLIPEIDPDEVSDAIVTGLEDLIDQGEVLLKNPLVRSSEKIVMALLEMIREIDQMIRDVRGRIYQYAKG